MNEELMEALTALCEEKGIGRNVILDALEAALVAAYKRNFNSAQNVEVQMDRKTGAIKVMSQKEVAEIVEPLDEQEYISLAEARRIDPQYQIGDIVNVEVTPRDFGRIAAMTAKQVVTQRLREAERGVLYSEYTEKENQLLTGKIERIERGNLFVDIGKLEAVMPVNEQVKGETYQVHDYVKGYVSEVRNGVRGTQIVLSRTHPGLVKKLFEQEVPEIAEGIVQVKGIAREAGSRTKIAVYSTDPDVDAQGACIGAKGLRVQNIGDELGEEKLDIVKWSDVPQEYITASLSPAKVLMVDIHPDEMVAHVVVPENQLSLAIGKSGQNVRLAAKLTGWKIDITPGEE